MIDLPDPEYTSEERALLDALRSRINVARAILRARVSMGLSQAAVGKAAGTKQSRVSELEAMKGNVRLDTLDRIARVLGLTVALVPRVPPPSPDGGEYREIHRAAWETPAFGRQSERWAPAASPWEAYG